MEFKTPADCGTFENEPAPQRDDVIRGDYMEEKTVEEGQTKNLLTHWKNIGQNEEKEGEGTHQAGGGPVATS